MEQSKKEMIALQSTEKKDLSIDKLAMLRQGNVSLILDSYDDLFSDFDPRPYSERALSDDFLIECKRATRERTNSEELELRLLVPKNKRDIDDEIKIKRRLRAHFTKHYVEKQKELVTMKKEGLAWFACGILFIIFATVLSEMQGVTFKFLFVIFEPAGWFTTWTGLQKMFLDVREKLPDSYFYEKMGKMQIMFYSY